MNPATISRKWVMSLGGAAYLAWFVLQLLFVYRLGIHHGGDTHRYLEAAQTLLEGGLPGGKALSYLGYDLFVGLFLGAGLGLPGVVAGQMLLAAAAGWCLYRIGEELYDERVGLAAAILYLLYPSIQVWNVYLLTESLFVSATIISMYLLLTARSCPRIVGATLSVVFTTLVRPHGVVVPAAIIIYLCSVLLGKRQRVTAGLIVGGFLCLLPLLYRVVGRMLAFETPLEHFLSGTVIWGYAEIGLNAPVQIDTGSWPRNPIAQIILFALAEPVFFTKLAGAKLFWFLVRARPYYSDMHNLFIVITLMPFYVLAIVGLWVRPRLPAARILLAAIWLLPGLVVALTFADWDSRHSLVTLPAVFLLAAAGAVKSGAVLTAGGATGRTFARIRRPG